MKRIDLQHAVLSLSHGLFSTVTDLTLYVFFLGLTSFGKRPTAYGYEAAFREADNLLSEFNYNTIRKTFTTLKNKNLVTYTRGKLKQTLTLTKDGNDYIRQLIPNYKEKRPWDGRIYLITYDIPETKRTQRNILRHYLIRLGAGMLQESVFLMFKNPKKLLQIFIDEKELSGVVIVSNMGKGGTIGEENLPTLIKRIYKLDRLNLRYAEFLALIKRTKQFTSLTASFYLSILKDDPQLPFEILPKDWLGEKAKSIFQKHTH